MKEWTVSWRIQVDGETPEEAARTAREYLLDPRGQANIFDVEAPDDQVVEVDLGPRDN